jgi:hypothetical protein
MDSTMAATDCAIKQVRHSVVLAESARSCVPPRTSNDWKPQEWATCATVATSSRATHKDASNFAPAVFVRTFTIVLPSYGASSQIALISQVTTLTGDSSTRMAID